MFGGGNVIAPVKCDLHSAASGPVPCPPAKMGPFDANRNRAGCSRHISEKPQSPQPAQAVAVFFARGRLRRAYGPSLMGKRYPLPAPASPTFAEGSADQHLHRAGRSEARHQGGRRRHLARQLHALRSRLLRPRAKNLATPRQPVRHEVGTHVLGDSARPGHASGR